jgi:phosphonate transport system permease protein
VAEIADLNNLNNQSALPRVLPDAARERLLRPVPPITLRFLLVATAILLILLWSLAGVQPDQEQLGRGKPPLLSILDFLQNLFPARWDMAQATIGLGTTPLTFSYPIALTAIFQTIQIALIGTLGGVIMALPFGLLAARNTSPHPVIYQGTRLFLNAIRAVPELIYALLFVSAVGLGPFPGALALAFAGIGSKGKLYAEAIEAIDPQQVLAVRATGANRLQAFMYGVVPQAIPLVLSYSILSFEANVRAATILGIVGAGGLGFLLQKYMQLFQFRELMGAIILVIVTVTVIDRISDYLRKKFI